jgi:hypothetical protein
MAFVTQAVVLCWACSTASARRQMRQVLAASRPRPRMAAPLRKLPKFAVLIGPEPQLVSAVCVAIDSLLQRGRA